MDLMGPENVGISSIVLAKCPRNAYSQSNRGGFKYYSQVRVYLPSLLSYTLTHLSLPLRLQGPSHEPNRTLPSKFYAFTTSSYLLSIRTPNKPSPSLCCEKAQPRSRNFARCLCDPRHSPGLQVRDNLRRLHCIAISERSRHLFLHLLHLLTLLGAVAPYFRRQLLDLLLRCRILARQFVSLVLQHRDQHRKFLVELVLDLFAGVLTFDSDGCHIWDKSSLKMISSAKMQDMLYILKG
ncbi:uncharacterized protein LOC109792822 [Cajanus cajan]|uniref:uncharacterized protein LOC109792822 n=1 Tax=Cajanus cajan TaxID=3821 RepID=UPI0010FAE889|nr:uncharacterized protein LOC109792822 [Cajanus cajan]